jgi:uncharacterized membrane protein YfcA
MVPLLVLWAGLPQHRANGTSLLAIVPIALVGVVIYYRQGSHPQVDLAFALLLTLGSVAGAYLGARLVKRIPEHHLTAGVALLMAVIGVKELVFT